MNNRVVVTGLGIISAIGTDLTKFEQGLIEGSLGLKKVQGINTLGYRTDIAGEVNVEPYVSEETDRCLDFVIRATEDALQDAHIDVEELSKDGVGVAIATSLGCVNILEKFIQHTIDNSNVPTNEIDKIPHCSLAIEIAKRYGIHGSVVALDTACATGTNIIGYAYDLIKSGKHDLVIAGSADILSALSYSGFSGMMNLTKEGVCRPFDQNRTGLVLGEGCGIVILESLEHINKRNGKVYAEIVGYGISNDAYHETRPDPNGHGAKLSMKMALFEAGIESEQLDYINAHGTGTEFNDLMEVKVVKDLMGNYSSNLKMSSIKGAIGHTLGAAGSIEFIASVLALKNGFVPPTINTTLPIASNEELDLVIGKSKFCDLHYVCSNSFGFAGNCSSIIIKKWVGEDNE